MPIWPQSLRAGSVALTDISPRKAAAELLRRRRARDSLLAFALAVAIPGAPVDDDPDSWVCKASEHLPLAAHHRLILEEVQHCLETPMGRLMLFFPPGSAKSTYAGVLAPAWAMGKWPGYKVISTSYAAKPAYRSSKRTRAICSSPEYVAIWPESEGQDFGRTTIQAGSAAVDEWSLTNDSTLLASGILGAVTSARADALLIDDPVSGRQEADSEAVRGNTRDAYDDDLLTRLKPGASIILIQTRWHPEDLAGSILPEDWDGESGDIACRDGQTWRVLCVPAQADRADDPLGRAIGEYLWPEWFTPAHWAQYKGNARTWSSLYQQKPRAESGNQFEREWFQWYDPDAEAGSANGRPAHLLFYGASDFALTEKQLESKSEPDFTEHGVAGLDDQPQPHLWLVDWWFKQVELDASVGAQLAMVRQHEPVMWFGEKGGQENAAKPMRRLLSREADTFASYEFLPSVTDKVARVQSFRAMVKAGRVHLPLNRPWAKRLVDQLVNFPKARFDDGVDVCGLLGRGVDAMIPAVKPQVNRRTAPEAFTEPWMDQFDREDAASEAERNRFYG
jgi:predicted phage terminase large subunit-like protein